jgi:hypothetical protein
MKCGETSMNVVEASATIGWVRSPAGRPCTVALVADDRTENGADDQAYEKLGVQSLLSVGPGVVAYGKVYCQEHGRDVARRHQRRALATLSDRGRASLSRWLRPRGQGEPDASLRLRRSP